ncbi:hypothetical protein TTHERM_01512230 (macronuclear) [Tetrahymena thermophila SB210]|uniref:Uncharacterized protein n=1 Tax=Tetrahymena thermophila (strain SB210) TaxID=312017 RepID=Q24CQ8_TETTS|nr:hypothetical protein TTHERM_01512230 [Tetrahymena thermophila SB210]EAS05568.1 hypothetical protein TTHERM_01512230 [Tetrahymena thermophila SB210]|eukprot:XP_001025813.1 hypothetical protein TTHERM_01512230 [Tetrahymena thermophila SB210]
MGCINTVDKDQKIEKIKELIDIFNSIEQQFYELNKSFYKNIRKQINKTQLKVKYNLVILFQNFNNQDTQCSIPSDLNIDSEYIQQYYQKIEEFQDYLQCNICKASLALQSCGQKYTNNIHYLILERYINKFYHFAYEFQIPDIKQNKKQKHVGTLDDIGSLCESVIMD